MVQAPCRAQSCVFAQVLNPELREIRRGLLDEVAEHRFVVVADQDDFAQARNLGKSFEGVIDDGVAGDFEQGLSRENTG